MPTNTKLHVHLKTGVWHKRACGYTICSDDKKCKCWNSLAFCVTAAANEEISIQRRNTSTNNHNFDKYDVFHQFTQRSLVFVQSIAIILLRRTIIHAVLNIFVCMFIEYSMRRLAEEKRKKNMDKSSNSRKHLNEEKLSEFPKGMAKYGSSARNTRSSSKAWENILDTNEQRSQILHIYSANKKCRKKCENAPEFHTMNKLYMSIETDVFHWMHTNQMGFELVHLSNRNCLPNAAWNLNII